MALFIRDKPDPDNLDNIVFERVLLDPSLTGASRLSVFKLFVPKGFEAVVETSANEIAFLQVLSGKGKLAYRLFSDKHIGFFSEEAKSKFIAMNNTTLIKTVVKNFKKYDNLSIPEPRKVKILNWFDEPVLQSEHDARKRVYIATKVLWGTNAIKGEIIIYPPKARAPAHYHLGAEHFQFILSGEGVAILGDREINFKEGDLIYNFEKETHSFENRSPKPFSFVEFFVPGECKTVWTTTEKVCTWVPTNKNLSGSRPVRFIPKHVHGEKIKI